MHDQNLHRATCALPKTFLEKNDVKRSAKADAVSACFSVWRHGAFVDRVMSAAKIAGRMRQHRRQLARAVFDMAVFDLQSDRGKPSGYGKNLGTDGVREFFNTKLVPTACAEAPAAATNVATKGEPA